MKKQFFKYDLIVIIVIIIMVVVCFLFLPYKQGNKVIIIKDNQQIGIYNLNEDQVINIDNENILIIENNEIYMKDATCPDHTCIKQGHIQNSGESIICLPHQLIVKIINGDDNQDAKTY